VPIIVNQTNVPIAYFHGTMIQTYDYIVIGVGSMGSATCYQLAKRGKSVLGLEQFSTPHEYGSHAGESRIIRKAYFEHPNYIPLLMRAYENWAEISERSGQTLYHRTGLFYAAPKGHSLLENIKHAASLYKVPLQQHVASPFDLPADYETLFEPDAGYVEPEHTIRAFVKESNALGAAIHEGETVKNWKVEELGVIVSTSSGEYLCKKIVITAGAWSAKLIPGIAQHLNVTRQVITWLKPSDPSLFSADKFPCWMIATDDSGGSYYGFPILPEHPGALKLAYHFPADSTDADQVNRTITDADTGHLHKFMETYLPAGAGKTDTSKVCLYSNSPDEHFVIGNMPGFEDRVCVAWGFSGHGFKFVPVVGEIMADLAMYGKTALPIGFLSPGRLG
jgi:sarcosine oxidase